MPVKYRNYSDLAVKSPPGNFSIVLVSGAHRFMSASSVGWKNSGRFYFPLSGACPVSVRNGFGFFLFRRQAFDAVIATLLCHRESGL